MTTDQQVMEIARRQVSLSFLMSTMITPPPSQPVRSEAMRVFTAYWNRELPFADLEAHLAVSGLPAEFLANGLWLYLNAEDIN